MPMEPRDRKLPEDRRELFRRPMGRDLGENELIILDNGSKLVTVGDVVSCRSCPSMTEGRRGTR